MLYWPESDMKDIRWYRYWIGYLLYSAHIACSPRIMIIIGQDISSSCYPACCTIREIISDQPETSYCFLFHQQETFLFIFPCLAFNIKYAKHYSWDSVEGIYKQDFHSISLQYIYSFFFFSLIFVFRWF